MFMMRYFFVSILVFIIVFCVPVEAFSQQFPSPNYSVLMYSIDELFDSECLSNVGKIKLKSLDKELKNKLIFVECYTNNELNHISSWELSLIYSYNIVMCLMNYCGVDVKNISYIGYGFSLKSQNYVNSVVLYLYEK